MASNPLLGADETNSRIEELARDLAALVTSNETPVLVGIKSRGAVLAARIQSIWKQKLNIDAPLGAVDITLYRDDLSQLAAQPLVRGTDLPFDIEGKTVILIDDVLYTGRTIRAALNELSDFGRPRAIRLGVLIDRGLRELPIQPDCAALSLETTPDQEVQVRLREQDGVDEAQMIERVNA